MLGIYYIGHSFGRHCKRSALRSTQSVKFTWEWSVDKSSLLVLLRLVAYGNGTWKGGNLSNLALPSLCSTTSTSDKANLESSSSTGWNYGWAYDNKIDLCFHVLEPEAEVNPKLFQQRLMIVSSWGGACHHGGAAEATGPNKITICAVYRWPQPSTVL